MNPISRLLWKLNKEYRRGHSFAALPEAAVDSQGAAGNEHWYFCVCAIVKDEGPYLDEWLAMQSVIGAGHVFLYDNGSAPGQLEPAEPWIARGMATIIPWPAFIAKSNPQFLAYAHACAMLAGRCRWLGFYDVDEFLFSPGGGPVSALLRDYEDLRGLAVFRRDFGTCGHAEAPPGLVMENYRRRPPSPRRSRNKVKCVVDPAAVAEVRSAHQLALRGGQVLVDEARQPLVKGRDRCMEERCERFCMNHYISKSAAEFREKLARGRMIRRDDWADKVAAYLEGLDRRSTETDEAILQYAPAARARMEEVCGKAPPPCGL